jgi:rhodanese-related sulfurtransferase
MVEDIAPRAAWEALLRDPDAQLVDVRTQPEWAFVGLPDLGEAGKQAVLISWQSYPTMQVDARFTDRLREAGLTPDSKLYFLCRSGARSMAAATAAQQAGFKHAYNVADGFEGPPDAEGHRGTAAGWKAENLPWQQR